MTDLYGLFEDEDPNAARQKAEALTAALRRKRAVGELAVLTGDKVLGRFGATQLDAAERGEGMLAQAGGQRSGQRLQRALQVSQQGFTAGEGEKERGFRGNENLLNRALEREKMRSMERIATTKADATQANADEKAEAGLRKELMTNPQTKEFLSATVAFDKVRRAAADPSAAGDLALIFGYMKTLDPTSSVREGEFANAQNAGGVDSRVASLYNRILSGERLSEAQRADFVKSAATQYEAQKAQYDRLAASYRSVAAQSGAAPERVALPVELDLNAPTQQPAASAPTSVRSAEDEAALNWARSNPKDPRAAAILKKLGVQ